MTHLILELNTILRARHTERAQHIASLARIFLCWLHAVDRIVYKHTWNYVLNYINMSLYEWNVAYMWCQFYRTSMQFLFSVFAYIDTQTHWWQPKPLSKEFLAADVSLLSSEFRIYIFRYSCLFIHIFIYIHMSISILYNICLAYSFNRPFARWFDVLTSDFRMNLKFYFQLMHSNGLWNSTLKYSTWN